VEARDHIGVRSLYSSLIGCGPVQMASAGVLPPSDHRQVEVEFSRVSYLQDDDGICFLFVVCPLVECGVTAQELCG
jgi:hypothetical protein